MTWEETNQQLEAIYTTWRELDEVEPTAGRPKKGQPPSSEWKAWRELKDRTVVIPSIHLANIRYALLIEVRKQGKLI